MNTSDRFGGGLPATELPRPAATPSADHIPALPLGAAEQALPNGAAFPSVDQLTAWANEFFKAEPSAASAGTQPGADTAQLAAASVMPLSAASGEALPSVADPRRQAAAAANPLGSSIPTGLGANEVMAAHRATEPVQRYYFLTPELPAHPSDPRITKATLAVQPLTPGPGTWDTIAPYSITTPSVPSLAAPALPVPAAAPAVATPYPTHSANAPATSYAGTPAPSAPQHASFGAPAVPQLPAAGRGFEVSRVRADFPILHQTVQGRPLVWLDNAATTQKPNAVIDRLSHFYRHENSNIHRGAHALAARSTDAYEQARESVRQFLNAGSTEELVFVRGATEGINLVANSWGGRFIEPGDEIIVTRIEHHSNIVPWKQLCERTGARLRVAEVDDTGQVDLEQYERLFNAHTRLVAFTQVSNALGTILPAQAMTHIAHRYGARVLIDGAQAVCHMPVDVQALDADFYVFSGHKVFGPTGIGVVYGKRALLAAMPPWQGGGNMIVDVTFDKTVYAPPPARFEAGTGNIADAVGLGAALDYLRALGLENVARYEHELLEYGTRALATVPGLHFVGTAKEKAAVLGFVLENMSSEQVGAALSKEGIAVRAGHHCAQPALRRFGYESTVRPSLAMYNDRTDIDALVAALCELQSQWPRR